MKTEILILDKYSDPHFRGDDILVIITFNTASTNIEINKTGTTMYEEELKEIKSYKDRTDNLWRYL